jgi:glycosyltransferase A (GT-A) superfamily protein (DUF2064 family)
MRNAMADAFHEGAGMVALIGTDLPSLPPEYINDAFTMLEHDADLVLGPADDGGFYLIASRAPLPPILDDIDWGTASVHAQVVAAAVDAGMTVGFARPWFDVDTPEELARVVSDSRSQNLNMRIRGTREIRR